MFIAGCILLVAGIIVTFFAAIVTVGYILYIIDNASICESKVLLGLASIVMVIDVFSIVAVKSIIDAITLILTA